MNALYAKKVAYFIQVIPCLDQHSFPRVLLESLFHLMLLQSGEVSPHTTMRNYQVIWRVIDKKYHLHY